MASVESIVIVGGGLAGAKAAEALREQGYQGAVTLVAGERHLPYERPPLSKDYLLGKAGRLDFEVHDEGWYQDNDIDLRRQRRAVSLDVSAHGVGLDDGTSLGYDKLILATGSSPRLLRLAGADAAGVLTLRTVDDSEQIQAALVAGRRLVIIGGGWIGMEIAAGGRERGVAVTVVEAAELPLAGVLGPEIAESFLRMHREHGVDFELGAALDHFEVSDGHVTGAVLAEGRSLPADVVVVGVGAAPNVELAESAGLAIDNGVLVDARLQTSDPDVFAIGDIANEDHPVLGSRVRVEHWANALNQPAIAATNALGGDTTYAELPYFFSDQYDLGMEYIGHAPPGSYARVVTRGDVDKREFIAFWLDAGNRVLAGMNVNVWDVVDEVKALILSKQPVDVDRLTDPEAPLSELV
jgi:3-phenylpropionate/trans-cinnamate dioxygenase ferredoxin reductase component